MRRLVRRQILELSGATEYAKEISALTVGAKYGLAPEDVVDLSLNINVFGPPLAATAAVQKRLGTLHRYPDVALAELKGRLAALHQVTADRIVLSDGLDEMLKLIAQTFIEPGDEAIIPIPTFPRYELEVRIMGGHPLLVPLDDSFQVPVEAILDSVTARTKLIFICSPNNPTGVTVSQEAIRRLLKLGEDGPLVVVDEAVIYPLDPGSMGLLATHRNLMVLRTFSKYYGLAGARVGYAALDPELAALMDVVRPPFNVNQLGEAAVLGALSDPDFVVRSRRALDAERGMLMGALAAMPGIATWPSQTSIMLIEVGGTGMTAPEVTEALAKKGVVVVDCRSYAGLEHRDFIRISIGTTLANRQFIRALAGVLAERAGSDTEGETA